jgi:phospholipid/cholesterol/gamma-HCH transport system substrate-binding protein
MENRAHALLAGLFTIVLGAALIVTAFWMRGKPIAQDAYVLYTRGSVAGLNPQASVRYRGVEVGKVETIEFDPADPRVILVGISVRSGTPVTRGAYAQLAAQGVTGLSYVQINEDGKSSELRDPADAAAARIELRPSFLERVTDSSEALLTRLGTLATQLGHWLNDDNRKQMSQVLSAFETAAQNVSALAQGARPGVKAVPELAGKASTTLGNADQLMADMRGLIAGLNQRIDALDRVAKSAERIDASIRQASLAAADLGTGASRDTLPRLNALLDDVARATRGMERMIEDLSANPQSLVFGRSPVPPGPGEPGFAHGARK